MDVVFWPLLSSIGGVSPSVESRLGACSHLDRDDLSCHELQLLLNNMISPFSYYKMLYDERGRAIDFVFISVNKAFERETGLKRSQVLGRRVLEVYPSTERYWIERLGKVAQSGNVQRFIEYSSALGKWYDVQAYSPCPGNVAITLNDVTIIYRDPVTGLPNKNAMLQAMNTRIGSRYEQFAMVLVDLDDFKDINTSFGSVIGDRLLFKVAARLRAYQSDRCEVFSYNGDEFVLFIKDYSGGELAKFTEKVLEELREPFYLDSNCFYVSASCGISSYPRHGKTANELVMNADLAKYRAKEQARGSYFVFDEAMGKSLQTKVRMQTALRQALDMQEFHLCYQPQIDAGTLEVVGFEALIRRNSPEFGSVPPLSFIKTAEDSRLIIPIGRWVLETACRYLKALNEGLRTNYFMSVNISGAQILSDDFVDDTVAILDACGLSYQNLELEITESTFFDSFDKLAQKVNALRALGIKVAIDDFGTGFSSLSELKNLSMSALKIDKSFIDDLLLTERNQHIVTAIIIAGHAMGQEIVAEGVETKEQLEMVRRLACDRIQGYKISKPLTGEDLPGFLETYQTRL